MRENVACVEAVCVVKSCFIFEIGITKMSATSKQSLRCRSVDGNIWLSHDAADPGYLASLPVRELRYEVLASEEAVGRAMFDEIKRAADAKDGALVVIIVGGRDRSLARLEGKTA